jgi:hypothetical protein
VLKDRMQARCPPGAWSGTRELGSGSGGSGSGGGLSVNRLPPLTHVLGRLLFYSIPRYPGAGVPLRCTARPAMGFRVYGLWLKLNPQTPICQ